MTWLDPVLKILTVVVTLVVGVLGAQLWRVRSENRRLNSEASHNDASAASTITAMALTLVAPLSARNAELNATVSAWEQYEDLQRMWNLSALRQAEEAGNPLPPPPDPPY